MHAEGPVVRQMYRTRTHTRLMALFAGLPRVGWYRFTWVVPERAVKWVLLWLNWPQGQNLGVITLASALVL